MDRLSDGVTDGNYIAMRIVRQLDRLRALRIVLGGHRLDLIREKGRISRIQRIFIRLGVDRN